jgi:CheY-like chemotaxis protein
VEDDTLVALDIIEGLKAAGAVVHGRAGSVKEALRLIESKSFDAALLDANLRGEQVDEIAAALTRRKIPFLFVTGYGADGLPRAFGTVALLNKPFSTEQLVQAAARLVNQRADIVQLREQR